MNFVTSSWVIFPKGEKHWHSLNYWVVQTVESRKSAVAENVCVGVLLLLMFQMLFSFWLETAVVGAHRSEPFAQTNAGRRVCVRGLGSSREMTTELHPPSRQPRRTLLLQQQQFVVCVLCTQLCSLLLMLEGSKPVAWLLFTANSSSLPLIAIIKMLDPSAFERESNYRLRGDLLQIPRLCLMS